MAQDNEPIGRPDWLIDDSRGAAALFDSEQNTG